MDDYVTDKVLERLDKEQVEPEYELLDAERGKLSQQVVDLDLDIYVLQEKFAQREVEAKDYYSTLDALRKQHRRAKRESDEKLARMNTLWEHGQARQQWDDWSVDRRRRADRVAEAGPPGSGTPRQ
ncbi:MAG TPA: hypothetical protein VNO54_23735 [Streptosporangiaceae bacterium]|nr:hypothetical protein [Streptosporangiaceae bacterium]